MKAIILLCMSLIASSAFAGEKFQVNDYIAGEVVAVEHLCPVDVICVTDGTILRIKFTFTNGCESLKSLKSTVLEDGVEVAAIRAINGDVCTMAMKYPVESVSLSGIYPPFTLSFKGTTVAVDIEKFTEISAQ